MTDKRINRFASFLCTALLGRFYAIFALKVVVLLGAGKGAESFFSPRIKITVDFVDCLV